MKSTAKKTAARHVLLRRILERGEAATQGEIVSALAAAGHPVTQATVSRDLMAIGARKVLSGDGAPEYRVMVRVVAGDTGEEELALRMREFVVAIRSSLNLVVLSTPPGGAGPVAAALDRARLSGVVGTIGGDDTVLVVAAEQVGGKKLKSRLEMILEN